MQLAIKKQLWFTSYLMGNMPSWRWRMQGKPALSRYDLYLTCDVLPLDRFIRCLCNGEYSQLVRTGTAPQDVLLQAWDNIYTEYVELDGSTNTIYLNQVRRDMMLLSSRIDRVITIVRTLEIAPDQRLIADLKALRLPFKYDYKNQTQFRKDLVSSIHWLAQWRLEYSRLEKELEGLVKANEDGAKVDRSYFDTALARLSRYNKYQVHANNVTVTEFVTMMKDYLNYVEQSNRANGQQR